MGLRIPGEERWYFGVSYSSRFLCPRLVAGSRGSIQGEPGLKFGLSCKRSVHAFVLKADLELDPLLQREVHGKPFHHV